jgi:hypothetical protein
MTRKNFNDFIDCPVVSVDEPHTDKVAGEFMNNDHRLAELALRHEDAWKVTSNNGKFAIVEHIYRANPVFKDVDELCIAKSASGLDHLKVGTIGSFIYFWKTVRMLSAVPLAGSVVVFDSNTPEPEPTEPPTESTHAVPSLHIVSPILRHADFSRPFAIEGFLERDAHGAVEHFTGQLRWDENGRVVDAKFKNSTMQAEAEQWRIEDRPKIVYWHSNDDDGGLQLKAMGAAA